MAGFIRAKFNPYDYRRWMSRITGLRTMVKLEQDLLPQTLSYQYRNEVSRVISQQDFHKSVPALSSSYRDWKAGHGFPTSIGILKRDLLQNLTVLKEGRGWYYSGVDPTAMDQGGKNWYLQGAPKRIITYAIWLEEGRDRTHNSAAQPARPIFIPTALWFADNKWIKHNDIVLNLMKRMW